MAAISSEAFAFLIEIVIGVSIFSGMITAIITTKIINATNKKNKENMAKEFEK